MKNDYFYIDWDRDVKEWRVRYRFKQIASYETEVYEKTLDEVEGYLQTLNDMIKYGKITK